MGGNRIALHLIDKNDLAYLLIKEINSGYIYTNGIFADTAKYFIWFIYVSKTFNTCCM